MGIALARLLAAVATVAAAALLWVALTLPPAARPLGDGAGVAAPEARGVFHVHSRRSDGSGSIDEIAAAAAAADLDFVVVTDHGSGTRRAPASYRSGVLVVDGVEISTDGGHYIALGLPATPYPLGGDARGVVEDVGRLGGFGVVAHPASPRAELAWDDWSLPVDAVEWLNGDSEWRDDGAGALVAAAARYWWRGPESLVTLVRRPTRALAHWDTLTGTRPVVGLAGTDAHARLATGIVDDGYADGLAFRFPGYRPLFRTFALRVELDAPLTGDAESDAARILDRIRAGRVYTAVDALATPARLSFTATAGGGTVTPMGGWVTASGDIVLTATLAAPDDARIALLTRGREVAASRGRRLSHRVTAGDTVAAYRVEVTLPEHPPMPWVVGNPIYVGPASGPDPDRVSPPATSGAALAPTGWRPERSDDAVARVEPAGAALRLAFALGPGRDTYAAAAYDLAPGELTADAVVWIDVEASRPVRGSLQLRDDSPEGDRRWRLSFYADTTRRTVGLPIGRLAPVTPDLPSRAEVAAVDTLLVVIDTVNTPAGTAGTLTIDGARLAAPDAR